MPKVQPRISCRVSDMSERYRKVVVRWRSLRVASVGLVLVLASIFISLLFIEYLSARGFEDKVEIVQLGMISLPFRVAFLPLTGIAALFVFAWIYLVQETAYVRASPGPQREEGLVSIKIVKYAALVVVIFTSFLFTPYLLSSTLFLQALAGVTSLLGFLESPIRAAISMLSSLPALNENLKYPLSLNLAALAVMVAVLLLARRRRLALRRR